MWFPSPIESAYLPEINEGREKHTDGYEDLTVADPAEVASRYAPGEQKLPDQNDEEHMATT
jgi:hypothetical protein